MAKARRFEAQLLAAEGLRQAPVAQGIRTALAHASGLIVAPAARAVAEHRLEGFEPDLRRALDRLYDDPVEHDPQCRGKLALIAALDALGSQDAEPFLRAARHVQLEPVWGGSQDSAPPLRIRATQAVIRIGHHGMYRLLGELLVDAVGEVRGAAAQMLGAVGGERAALLLRLRLAVGDGDGDVLADYAAGLLACEGAAGLPPVVALLDHDDRAVVGGAALALGGSRLAEALAPLQLALDQAIDRQLCRTLIDAIALLRSEAAAAALLALVADGDGEQALAAVKGLRLYRERPAIAERTARAIAARADQRLTAAWEAA